MGLSFVPLTASAMAGVPPADQGLASGLVQTAMQLGVALGLTVLTTVAAATQGLLGHPAGPLEPAAVRDALTSGYAVALRAAGLLSLLGSALAILVLGPASGRPPGRAG